MSGPGNRESPSRDDLWLEDYGGNDLWKRCVFSLEWNRERVIDDDSGDTDENGDLAWPGRISVKMKIAKNTEHDNTVICSNE